MPEKPQRKRPPRRPKRVWEPPRVKTGKLFESNSLACGKGPGGDDECFQSGTVS